jgi:hypothetical protein
LPILWGLPRFPAARQLPDLAFIVEGQRFGQWCLQSRLQESDVPNVPPNELHKDPVVRFGVAAHVEIIGEDKAKAIHRVTMVAFQVLRDKDKCPVPGV